MRFQSLALGATALVGYLTPVGAAISSLSIQRKVVDYVVDCMGDEIYDTSFLSGQAYQRTRFHPCVEAAKESILPTAGISNLKRWVRHYALHGELKAETKERIKMLRQKHPNQFRLAGEEMWNQHDTDMLKSIVDADPDLYLDEIQSEMVFAGRRCYSLSYIWKKLTSNAIQYSLRRAIEIATERDEEERSRYLSARKTALKRPDMALFIDETFKDRNAARRKRKWGRRGRRRQYRAPLSFAGSHDQRYSVLAACDINGFVIEACERVGAKTSPSDTDETHGTIDADRFELWVENFLCPVLGRYEFEEPRSVVILDNASTHHTPRVKELIQAAGAEILYTAPYSPDLNPIEEMFSKYKAMLRRHRNISLEDAHVAALLSITPFDARGYFRNASVPGGEVEEAEEEEEGVVAAIATACAAVSSVVALLHSQGQV